MIYDVRIVVNVIWTSPVVPAILIIIKKNCIRIVYTTIINLARLFSRKHIYLLDRCYVKMKKKILVNMRWRVNVVR